MLPWARLLLIAVVALASAPVRAAVVPTRPNIVLILADDLGYGDLGCYGNTVIKTPRLDRLAAEGVRFSQCYSAAPVCSPARAAIMTGRNPNRLGIRDWIPQDSGIFLKTEEVTVAELLRDAGYHTGFAGKWHLNSRFDGVEPTPGDHGFDHWLATQNNSAHRDPKNFVRNGRRVGPMSGHASKIVVDEGVGFIDAGPKDKPFLLCVWFHAPHEQVDAPAEFQARYAHVEDETKREYYGSVEYMDQQVGRLLDALDEHGLRENTLVFFTSDNGPETLHRYKGSERSHGSTGGLRGMKLHLHEGGIRVPAIARWPAGKVVPSRGGTNDQPVCGLDLLPTFAEAAGVKPPEDRPLDGISMIPVLTARGNLRRPRPLYWQYDKAIGEPWRVAIRDGDWKLVADGQLAQFAVFNLRTDPSERDDRSAAEPARVASLSKKLFELHAEINAPSQ
jgi:arylsulfatase A